MGIQDAPQRVDLDLLRAQRKWIYNATSEREDSGYFDWGEMSPDGVYFKIGKSDQLVYCSLEEDPGGAAQFRVVLMCWKRAGHSADLAWRIELSAEKQPVRGTLLRHACGLELHLTRTSGNLTKSTVDIDGFHPDRKHPSWKLAQADLEARQTWVHYHYNWHGDAALGNYVDLHGDMDMQFGMESLENGQFLIPKAERRLLKPTR